MKKMKGQPSKRKNIFASGTFNKGLITKIHKKLIQLNRNNTTIKKSID